MQRERWLSGQRTGARPLTRSFYGWWPTAVFLARAGFIVIWLPLDVRCCRPVLARGWHGVIAGTGCCIALLHVLQRGAALATREIRQGHAAGSLDRPRRLQSRGL